MEGALREMGIDLEVALYGLKSVSYSSESDAIRFILERDPDTGKYEHPFIPINHHVNNMCRICFNSQDSHSK